MQSSALIDHGTLVGAHAILYGEHSPFWTPNEDIAIACLSSLLESIVLFDDLVLPAVPHGYSASLSTSFGDAITLRPLRGDDWLATESAAASWVAERVDLQSALDFCHLNFSGRHFVGSTDRGVALALTVVPDRDQFHLLRYILNPAVKPSLGDAAHFGPETEDSPAAKMVAAIRARHDDEYRRHLEGDHPIYRPNVDLQNIYWSVFRGRCYDLLAQSFALPYVPHPLRARAALGVRGLDMDNLSTPNPFLEQLRESYERGRRFVFDKTGDWLEPFVLSPVFPYVLSKARSKADILSITYDIRDSKPARSLRGCLARLNTSQSLAERLALAAELDELKSMLDAELGIRDSGPTVAFTIAGILSFTMPIPGAMARALERLGTRSMNPRLLFLRDVHKAMSQAAGLGKYYEFLTQSRSPSGALTVTDDELRSRAQYLYATHVEAGRGHDEARALTYRYLRQLTQRPAVQIRRTVDEALHGLAAEAS